MRPLLGERFGRRETDSLGTATSGHQRDSTLEWHPHIRHKCSPLSCCGFMIAVSRRARERDHIDCERLGQVREVQTDLERLLPIMAVDVR